MKNICELILALDLALNNPECRSYFAKNDNAGIVAETEKQLNIKFPKAIKEFYTIYNGGFILDSSISEKHYDLYYYDEIEWSSNAFLCLKDILYYYDLNYEFSIDFKNEEKINSKRLIPFFRSKENELFAFSEDSLIFWAKFFWEDTEEPLFQVHWINVYPDFESLLNEYIANDGEINFLK